MIKFNNTIEDLIYVLEPLLAWLGESYVRISDLSYTNTVRNLPVTLGYVYEYTAAIEPFHIGHNKKLHHFVQRYVPPQSFSSRPFKRYTIALVTPTTLLLCARLQKSEALHLARHWSYIYKGKDLIGPPLQSSAVVWENLKSLAGSQGNNIKGAHP